jgi:hypothetical protein
VSVCVCVCVCGWGGGVCLAVYKVTRCHLVSLLVVLGQNGVISVCIGFIHLQLVPACWKANIRFPAGAEFSLPCTYRP